MWGDIDDRPDGQPTPEPYVLVQGVLIERRTNPQTKRHYLHIGPDTWWIPLDLLRRQETMAIHPIGVPRKLKLQWDTCKILVYEDQIVHFSRADGTHFFTRSYDGHFLEILGDLHEAVQTCWRRAM